MRRTGECPRIDEAAAVQHLRDQSRRIEAAERGLRGRRSIVQMRPSLQDWSRSQAQASKPSSPSDRYLTKRPSEP
jgi:hypothetical protein